VPGPPDDDHQHAALHHDDRDRPDHDDHDHHDPLVGSRGVSPPILEHVA
jgi:hypothetical protein